MKNKIDLENKIKGYDNKVDYYTSSKQPVPADTYYNKAKLLTDLGKLYLSENKQNEDDARLNFKKAEECYNEAIKLENNNRLFYAKRAEVRSLYLQDHDGAVEDMTHACSLPSSGGTEEQYISRTLRKLGEINEISKKIEALPEDDPNKPILKGITGILEQLTVNDAFQDKKLEQHDISIEQINQENVSLKQKTQQLQNDLQSVKEKGDKNSQETKSIIIDLEKKVAKLNERVTKTERRIVDIEKQCYEMYLELKTKLDDSNEKLKQELDLLSLSSEDKTKIESYYKAFVSTIAAAYVTSQVVNSDKVELHKSLIIKLVSIAFSFVPIAGEAVSQGISAGIIPLSALISGISSIFEKLVSETGDTGKHKTITGNARKILKLAVDSSNLSQKVSTAAIQIVQDEDKQQQIINTTLVSLDTNDTNLLEKIKKFFKKLGKKYDKAMHGELYKNPAELLGKKDAENLLKKYLKLKEDDMPYGSEATFKLLITGCGVDINSTDIKVLYTEVSQGSCTDELKTLFSSEKLKSKLEESLKPLAITDKEIDNARMIIFKLLCMVVKESKDQVKAIKCIEDFAKKHQDLLQQIANEHPEYFGTKEIAKSAIDDQALQNKVIKALEKDRGFNLNINK